MTSSPPNGRSPAHAGPPLPPRQVRAEEVRAYLVALRGGAPFLSPTDASLLVSWLDDDVPVASIRLALERTAAARRARPTKTPFTLRQAKRHLRDGPADALPQPTLMDASALSPMVEALRQTDSAPCAALADALERLPRAARDDLAEAAMALLSAFHQDAWARLDHEDQRTRVATWAARLSQRFSLAPEEIATIAEEQARAELRGTLPWLTATNLWELLSA